MESGYLGTKFVTSKNSGKCSQLLIGQERIPSTPHTLGFFDFVTKSTTSIYCNRYYLSLILKGLGRTPALAQRVATWKFNSHRRAWLEELIRMIAIKSSLFTFVTVAVGGILLSTDAFAYIDPGTGTLLIQWLFGMAVASLVTLRIHWYRAKAFFSSKFGNNAIDEDAGGKVDDSGSD